MKNLVPLTRTVGLSNLTAALGLLISVHASSALAAAAGRADNAIWVHDQLYGTVATDTAFQSPPPQSTDVIFSFAGSGLDGQRSVAQYAPGDRDYNGGRWNVMVVTFTDMGKSMLDADSDGAVDSEIGNAETVLDYADLGLLTITAPGVYFECPLRPSRGN
jgi:hypothetical protein